MRVRRPRKRCRVLLLIQTASEWSRKILTGIAEYSREHGPWELFLEHRGPYEQLKIPRGWRGDGILARVDHAAMLRAITRSKVPVVNVSWLGLRFRGIPHVVSDQGACARLAVKHFRENGFRNLGYVGPTDLHRNFDELGREFAASAGAAKTEPHVFQASARSLAPWLRSLPKPVGLLVFSDDRGQEVVSTCGALKLRVPDDVAILSAEHDSVISALSSLPLSSLDMVPERIGHEAAAFLDRLMQGLGAQARENSLLIPPVGIVQRQSTDTSAVDDSHVSAALRHIRDHVGRPIQVGDLVSAVGLSRRALESRFRDALGRSPATEIRRVRLERVKRLLLETKKPLPDIATETGFNHVEVMVRAFQRHFGVPPGKYRRLRG